LPGVGAFGDAIESLRKLDLIHILKDIATSSKPFVEICLGMHLLMDESEEFGCHQGLGIIKESVMSFSNPCKCFQVEC
jgi:glutamine amidotransferase